jgi:hemolysin-activating ACP:hemolysin acyltransferase
VGFGLLYKVIPLLSISNQLLPVLHLEQLQIYTHIHTHTHTHTHISSFRHNCLKS